MKRPTLIQRTGSLKIVSCKGLIVHIKKLSSRAASSVIGQIMVSLGAVVG